MSCRQAALIYAARHITVLKYERNVLPEASGNGGSRGLVYGRHGERTGRAWPITAGSGDGAPSVAQEEG